MRRFTFLSLIILLASCSTTMNNYYQPTVSSWQGGTMTNLVKRWGKPDRVMSTSDGKTIYVYENSSYRSNQPAASYPMVGMHVSRDGRPTLTSSPVDNNAINRNGLSLDCIASFESDSNGKILRTDIQGGRCYMNENAAKRMTNPT